MTNPHLYPKTVEQMEQALEWQVANSPVAFHDATVATAEWMLDLVRRVKALEER